MRLTFPLLLLIILLLAGVLYVANSMIYASPSVQQARAAREWARTQEAQAQAAAEAEQAPRRAAIATGLMLAALIAAALAIAAGSALAVVVVFALARRALLVYPDRHTGLYPALPARLDYQVLSPETAQVMGAISAASHGGLRATTAGRVVRELLAPPRPPLLFADPPPTAPQPALLPDEIILPDKAPIYDARRPARVALPVGIAGAGPLSLSLANLGNVLIGGLPGTGKSELIASMLWALGAWADRGIVKAAVVDTKRVDFGVLPPDLALLWRPVAVEMSDGRALIAELLDECQRRFRLLESVGARSIDQYNAGRPAGMPYIVCFIDEIADWTGDRHFVEAALEIGRKGRGAGASLVMATQSPRADVIDSRLRALAGACIAGRTRDRYESAAILGTSGAERLPADKPGRMLVARGDVIPVQAYMAGIRTGEFDRRLALLPKRVPTDPNHPNHLQPPQPPVGSPVVEVVVDTPETQPVGQPPQRLERGRAPTPAVAAWMRDAYVAGTSKNAICLAVWGYKDGAVWEYLDAALESKL